MLRKVQRFASLCAVFGGTMVVGYASYQGWERGFASDLEIANWDPVIAGACGAGIAALGVFAWLYFGHAARGLRRYHAFLNALRNCAVLALTGCEVGGTIAAVAGFITFVAIAREGGGLWALGVCACGCIAHVAASHLLPWAKGEEDKPANEIAAVFDDRDEGP